MCCLENNYDRQKLKLWIGLAERKNIRLRFIETNTSSGWHIIYTIEFNHPLWAITFPRGSGRRLDLNNLDYVSTRVAPICLSNFQRVRFPIFKPPEIDKWIRRNLICMGMISVGIVPVGTRPNNIIYSEIKKGARGQGTKLKSEE